MKTVTKDKLIEILKECYTKADLCRVLDLKPTGGNYRKIDQLIKTYNLTWDNYLGRSYKKGKHVQGTKHMSLEEICVKDSTYTNTTTLKNRLIKAGLKSNCCEICGFSDKIELHHINGNPRDHRLENLQILCPNCHSKTDNFRAHNFHLPSRTHNSLSNMFISNEEYIEREEIKKIKRRVIKEPKEERFCKYCGKPLKGKKYKYTYCSVECYRDSNKGARPSFLDLINDFKELKSFTQVGLKYNISDNAVRKWCKLYGIPIHKSELKEFLSSKF